MPYNKRLGKRFKKIARKYNKKKGIKYNHKGGISKLSGIKTVTIKPGNKMIAPDKARIKFNSELCFWIAAATAATFVFNTKMNSVYLPFSTSLAPSVVAGTTLVTGSTAVASKVPAGVFEWLGRPATAANPGIYFNYIVTGAKCTISVTPQSVFDAGYIYLTAYNANRSLDTPTTMESIMNKPWGKVLQIGSSGSNRGRTSISMYIPIHKFMGITKQQYLSNMADYQVNTEAYGDFTGSVGGAAAADPALSLLWYYGYTNGDNDNTTGKLEFMVNVTYYVTMFNPQRHAHAIS